MQKLTNDVQKLTNDVQNLTDNVQKLTDSQEHIRRISAIVSVNSIYRNYFLNIIHNQLFNRSQGSGDDTGLEVVLFENGDNPTKLPVRSYVLFIWYWPTCMLISTTYHLWQMSKQWVILAQLRGMHTTEDITETQIPALLLLNADWKYIQRLVPIYIRYVNSSSLTPCQRLTFSSCGQDVQARSRK